MEELASVAGYIFGLMLVLYYSVRMLFTFNPFVSLIGLILTISVLGVFFQGAWKVILMAWDWFIALLPFIN